VRDATRGFDETTFGSRLDRETGRSRLDARNRFILNAGYQLETAMGVSAW
jgi:hypothetical protein